MDFAAPFYYDLEEAMKFINTLSLKQDIKLKSLYEKTTTTKWYSSSRFWKEDVYATVQLLNHLCTKYPNWNSKQRKPAAIIEQMEVLLKQMKYQTTNVVDNKNKLEPQPLDVVEQLYVQIDSLEVIDGTKIRVKWSHNITAPSCEFYVYRNNDLVHKTTKNFFEDSSGIEPRVDYVYNVVAVLNGEKTAFSEYKSIQLTSGVLDAKKSIFHFEQPVVGKSCVGTIQVKDNFGYNFTGRVNILVKVCGPADVTEIATVNSCGKGKYQFSFIPTVSGEASIHVVCNSEHLQNSPQKIAIQPGELNIQKSMVLINKIPKEVKKFEPFEVRVRAKDSYGNLITQPDLPIYITIDHGDKEKMTLKNGLYVKNVIPHNIGTLSISVTYQDLHITNSPIAVLVKSSKKLDIVITRYPTIDFADTLKAALNKAGIEANISFQEFLKTTPDVILYCDRPNLAPNFKDHQDYLSDLVNCTSEYYVNILLID